MEELRNYHFGMENLAFEGGGVKMVGHVGIIQVRRSVIYDIVLDKL